jgi:ATP-dependent Lon protease
VTTAQRIPLFPLSIILLPQSQVPLHIFEERYKNLINECLKNNQPFGINFIEENKLHSIGTRARISEVVRRYPDGKMDIVVEGIDRYQIESVDDTTADKVLYAKITPIDDITETHNAELAGKTIELFNELCDVAYKGTISKLNRAEWTQPHKLLSFVIAQKSGLESEQRQALLGITSENERLDILHDYLQKLLPRVRKAEKLNDLIRNDGYIPYWNDPS